MLILFSKYMRPAMDITYKLYLSPVHGVKCKSWHVVKSKEKKRNISFKLPFFLMTLLFLAYGTACVHVWHSKWPDEKFLFNFFALNIVIYFSEIVLIHGNFNGITKVLESTVIINQKLQREFQL